MNDISSKKKIQCKQCYRLLCKTFPVHDDKEESWMIEVQHRGYRIITPMMVATCPSCGTAYRITGEKGIEEKIPCQ